MKRLCIILYFLIPGYCIAQVKMSSETLQIIEHLESLEKSDYSAESFSRYPVYYIKNSWYLSIAGELNLSPDWSAMNAPGLIKGSVVGNIATLKVPVSELSNIGWDNVFDYIEVPSKVNPHLDKVIKDTRADSVQWGLGLPMGYTGKDVIIGVADWGFDYTHPMFYDTLLQETRVVAAWDQYRNQGDLPDGFDYGVEFDSVDELMNAGSDTSNIYGYNTHGSHVAGIAGGGGAGIQYRGMAPEAGFLFNTFLIDYASVIDGFVWMKEKAESLNKRLVINMSWGLFYIGTQDGNSLISQAISELSDQGVVFVSSGGNNGDANFHIKKEFDQDTIQTRIIFDSYQNTPNMWGQSITIWGEPDQPFDIRLSMYETAITTLDLTPFLSTATMPAYIDSFLVSDNDTVWYNITCDAAHPLNGRPHMRIRVRNLDSTIKVGLYAHAESGTVHFWNVVELTTGVGNWGLNFLAFGENGVSGDNTYGISEPACSDDVIAVAAYASGYINGAGNPAGGTLADFSSVGPLITGQMKPDLAAPGVSVASSISSFTDMSISSVNSVEFNGEEYDFARLSGTSMASPCVAGIVALMLDANPFLSSQQVEDILKETARLDSHTGDINFPGDVRWGMGKVNAYAAVLLSLATIGLEIQDTESFRVMVYPNPTDEFFRIGWQDHELPEEVTAFDLKGNRTSVKLRNGLADVSSLASGIYVLELKRGERIGYTRLVVQ